MGRSWAPWWKTQKSPRVCLHWRRHGQRDAGEGIPRPSPFVDRRSGDMERLWGPTSGLVV